jgi:hypothetical protein
MPGSCYLAWMRELSWRIAFDALWIVLVVVGVWLLQPLFVYACEDCIGGHPLPGGGYYFGEGGFKVKWLELVVASGLSATFLTGLFMVGSRAFRRRPGSVV